MKQSDLQHAEHDSIESLAGKFGINYDNYISAILEQKAAGGTKLSLLDNFITCLPIL